MKFQYLLPVLLPLITFGQSETHIKSSIKEVTVFTVGAEVSRAGKLNLKKGINEVAFEQLSPYLDEQSIQFNAGGDISILSMKYDVRYDDATQEKMDKAALLNAQLRDLGLEVKAKKDLLSISVNEEQVLMANTDFDVWEGMTVTQLEQGVNLVRNRLTEIKERKQKVRAEIKDLNKARQKIVNQLQKMRIEDAKPNGMVFLKIKSEVTKTVEAKISYVVANAGWEPFYDFRVTDVSKPLTIEYKAKVYQSTGEEWKGVKLVLSTGNPYEEGTLPLLGPWWLNFVSGNNYPGNPASSPAPQTPGQVGIFKGLVIDNKSGEAIPFANVVALNAQGNVVSGTTTDLSGNYALDIPSPATRLEVSYLGYHKHSADLQSASVFQTIRMNPTNEQLEEVVVVYVAPLIKRREQSDDINQRTYFSNNVQLENSTSMSMVPPADNEMIFGGIPSQFGDAVGGVINTTSKGQFKISQNPVNLKFDVDIAYDIPADGEEYKVAIEKFEKDVDYLYRAVPKLNEHAFLTASIVDWESMNLMNGSAGIYLEGTYLGETYLNVEKASDTLRISLGKDENIVVQRNTIKLAEGTRFLGSKKEQKFQYEIKVRNNKAYALKLEIKDQYPVAGNDDISVERIEHTEGKVEDKLGIITWEFILQPKEEKKINLIYSIRYPKGKNVNVR